MKWTTSPPCHKVSPAMREQRVTGDAPKAGAKIELRGLSKFYGEAAAVENIDLTVGAGEFLTFLGPSGSGKSTTLMMIAGFVTPTAGDILLNGASIVSQPVHKRNIGMVFQNYALFPHLSVERNVAFPLEMRGVGRAEIGARVQAALELVRLQKFGGRRPAQLSGGQQQRVALARALVFKPPVLLLDEPLGALDAKLREEMKFELKQLHHKVGATILFVTHDQEEALTLSDRIMVFEGGKAAQLGTPDALYSRPENKFVADFIGETNLLTGAVRTIDGDECRLSLAENIEVTAPLRPGWATPQQSASYTLRPEPVVLGDAAKGKHNSFTAKVQEFLFVGNSTKYLLELTPGISIKARVQASPHSLGLRAGDTITVGWDKQDMLLIESN